jgi:predicted RNA binding protein YcfA (HicA-like mRNA interferase family)
MTRYDKLVERLKRRPPDMDFDDVRKVLEARGFDMRPGTKHTAIFVHPEFRSITVPTVSG